MLKRIVASLSIIVAGLSPALAISVYEGAPEAVWNQTTRQVGAGYWVDNSTSGVHKISSVLILPDGYRITGQGNLGQASGGMAPGATYYAQVRDSIQTGATTYVHLAKALTVEATTYRTTAGGSLTTAGGLLDATKLSGALPAISGASLTDLTTGQVGLSQVKNVDQTNASNLTSGTVPDGRFPATLPAVSGANLTALNASNLASGTIPNGRFPTTLPASSGANLTALNASNLSSGTIPDGRFPSTLPAASGENLTNMSASQLTSGTVPNARIDSSSVTKQGNQFNGVNQLVRLDGSGNLPAAGGALLTSLTPANLSAGSLPAGVIASSIAVNAVGNAQITAVAASKITSGDLGSGVIASSVAVNAVGNAQITSVDASKITGTIPNAQVDSSSVTKAGNQFNAANQLVKLGASGELPALSGVNLTGISASQVGLGSVQNVDQTNASNLTSGTVPNARVDSSSVTKKGNQFNGASQLVETTAEGYLPALDARNLINVPGGGGGGSGMTAGASYYANVNPAVQQSGAINMASGTVAAMNVTTLRSATGNQLLTAGGLLDSTKLSGNLPSNVITSSVAANAVGSEQISTAAVVTSKIADDAVTVAKLKQAASGVNPNGLITSNSSGEFLSLTPLTTFYDLIRTGTADFGASTANTYDSSASTNPTFGRMRFDAAASSTTNCGIFEGITPNDFNQTLDPRLNQFWVKNGTATDNSAQRYVLRVASVTTGGAYASRNHTASMNVDLTTGGGAFADRQLSSPATLTNWRTYFVPGLGYSIQACRAGSDGTNDPSVIDSFMAGLQIRYAHTAPGE